MPCLTTVRPDPATTMAAIVEMVGGVGLIAPGAHEIDGPTGDRHGGRAGEHRRHEAFELGGRLAFCPQQDREPGQLGGGRLTGHDLVHCPRRRSCVQEFPAHQRREQGGPA